MYEKTTVQNAAGAIGILCGMYFLVTGFSNTAANSGISSIIVGMFLSIGGLCLIIAYLFDRRKK